MTDDMDPNIRGVLRPRSKAPTIIALAAIAVVCLCFSYRTELYSALITAPAPKAPLLATAEARGVSSEDLNSLKRQIAESSQSATDGLQSQKADLQKLADQISALSDKIDALQKAQAASAAHAEIRPEVVRSSHPRKSHIVVAHRKPVPPEPATTTPAPNFPILGPQSGGQ